MVTVERGVDPRRFALDAVRRRRADARGGARRRARASGRILCPRASGVLSALGLIASERRRDTARTVLLSGDDLTAERIAAEVEALRESIGAGLDGRPSPRSPTSCATAARRSSWPIAGAARPDPADLAERFAAEHERRYGYRDPDAEVELVNVRLALVVPAPAPEPRGRAGRPARARRRGGRASAASGWRPRCCAASRAAGTEAAGPCVFELPEATLVLPPGWRAEVDGRGHDRGGARAMSASLDPVTLQVLVGAPARRLRGDGRGADPRRALGEHQGAPRLLDGAVRRRAGSW